jgi:phosphate-selective porin OprO/OprP
LDDGEVATRLSHFYQPGVSFMKKTSLFSANSVAVAVAALCASMPAFAQVEAKVTGRVHFDTRNINDFGLNQIADRDSASVGDNFEVRRARIGISGAINKDITYEVVGNAVGSNTNFVDTAFVNYGFNKAGQLRAGRFKQPFSLEELTSSNNIDFMERSYGNQMVPGKRLGMMLHGEPTKGLFYGVSGYADGFNEVTNSNNLGSKTAIRVALNAADFLKLEDTVLHFGVANTQGKSQTVPVNSGNTQSDASQDTRATIVAFRTEGRGLNNAYRLQIGGDKLRAATSTSTSTAVAAGGGTPTITTTTTGGLGYNQIANNAVNIKQNMNGIELALAKGPFKFQAENFDSKYAASGTAVDLGTTANQSAMAVNARVKANYMEFMYNITGEEWSKSYKGGAFGGITPKSIFMKDYGGVVGNGIGAWQVGIRLSEYSSDAANTGACALGTSSCETVVGTATTTGGSGVSNKARAQNSETAKTTTYALNWFLNSNARVMLNYSETKFGQNVIMLDTSPYTAAGSGVTDKERVISLRTQINF